MTALSSRAERGHVGAFAAPGAKLYAAWAQAWWPTLALIGAVTVARIVYLALFCPYTLVEDEAHYWEWSRRLEWSYYSKGPGVAWVIAASSWLTRSVGLGETEFSVRLPAAVFGGVLLVAVAGLARAVVRDGRAGFFAVVCLLLIPAFQAVSMLMTIDVPYAACWALAAWSGFAALQRGSRWAWVVFGAALGAGFLFKYTILLLLPGIGLYAVLRRRDLVLAPGWGKWAAAGAVIFALGLVPVVLWNAQHDWATVRHLLGHLGVAGGDTVAKQGGDHGWRWSPRWTLEFVGSQLPMIGPVLILMGWSWIRQWQAARNERGSTDRSRRRSVARDLSFLTWSAAPILLFYLAVTLVTEAEGNWPLAGYITLAALAGWGVLELQRQWAERSSRPQFKPHWILGTAGTPVRLLWRTSLMVGILFAVSSLRLDLVAASWPMRTLEDGLRQLGVHKSERPIIPLGRLMGARLVAQDADRLMQELEVSTGQEAFIIGQQYGRASQLAFYMPGRPVVYSSSSRSDGGRRTQYDLWAETDLDDPALLGRPAVCVGGHLYQWEPAFERIEEYGMLEGEPKASRLTFIGYGYKGFPQ
jgi:4-amino-4-deoxy-L-arabinose transferase-like glycosyltransferase